MSKEVAKTVVQAGLIPGGTMEELRRWGAPLPDVPEGPEMPAEVVPLAIERAIQQEDFVQVRETDLSLTKTYLKKHWDGVLHIIYEDGRTEDCPVTYCVTSLGEYALPWDGDDITDIMTNGQTYLALKDGAEVYFSSARELFYGEQKMFLVCKPAKS
jgi:hypothetical protein